MSIRAHVAPTVLEIQGRHVVWLATPLDRAALWELGLLQRSMAIGASEAANAAELMHLPEASRAAAYADLDGAPGDKLLLAQATRVDDEVVCRQVFGARVHDQDEPVRLVLDAADEDAHASPERIWVGSLPLAEVQELSRALLSAWRGEVREGTCFRTPTHGDAGPS